MTVTQLNELLETELGSSPKYRWLRCDSHELRWPLKVLHKDGTPVMDFYCTCGTNVRIHKTNCTFTYPRYRIEMKNIFEAGSQFEQNMVKFQYYAIAVAQDPPDDWETRFGSLNKPRVLWMPMTSPQLPSPGYCLIDKPTKQITQTVIEMVREFRDVGADAHADQMYAEQEKREEEEVANNTAMLDDMIPMQLKPGTRSGNVSLSEVKPPLVK